MGQCTPTVVPILVEDPCQGNKSSTKCVISIKALTYLGLPPNSTLEDIIDAILLSLADVRTRVDTLENINTNTTSVSTTAITTTSDLTSTFSIVTRKVDASAGNIVITILSPQIGQVYNFKRIDTTINTVTIVSPGVIFDGNTSAIVDGFMTNTQLQFLTATEAIII